MTDQQIAQGLSSIATTHPYWQALDELLRQAIEQETDGAALQINGELALRQCGRLSMIKDFAGTLRTHMAALSKPKQEQQKQ